MALLTGLFGNIPCLAQFFVVCHSFLFYPPTNAFLVCTLETYDRGARSNMEF